MKPKTLLEVAELGDLEAVKRHFDEGDIEDDVKKEIALIAAHNHDLDLLRYVSNKNSTIVRKEGDPHYDVLRRAVSSGALDLVKYLVEEHDADVLQPCGLRAYPRDRHNALQIALIKGHLDILKYFLEDRNIDIHAPIDNDGSLHQTILFFAVKYGVKDHILKYLVEDRNVSLTMENEQREHVLYEACRQNNLKFTRYALDERKAKIDINGRNAVGETLVHVIVCHYSLFSDFEPVHTIPLLKYLVDEKKADVNIADDKGNTPLHCGSLSNETCTLLIEHGGGQVNRRNKVGDTPLHDAVSRADGKEESITLLKCLLEHGADVNGKNVRNGETPLISATHGFHLPPWDEPSELSFRVCEFLTRHGADINLADDSGTTPLHYAVRSIDSYHTFLGDDLRLFHHYLELGADVNRGDNDGDTPLHCAAERSTLYACQQLVEHGVNINLRNKKGETAVYLAVVRRAEINQRNKKEETAGSYLAGVDHSTKILEYLVGEKHADVNIATLENKMSPLHVAASMKDYHLCQYLVEHGAQTEVQDKEGRTPVQRATNKRVIDYLNSVSAKRDKRDVALPHSASLLLPVIYELDAIPARTSLSTNHSIEGPMSTFASDSVQVANMQGLLALMSTLTSHPKTSARSTPSFRVDTLDRRIGSFFDDVINRLRNDNVI